MEKKGQLGIGALPTVAIAFVVAAIVFAVGLQIVSDTGDDMTANSYEKNATVDAVQGMAKVPEKFPLMGTVIAAVIIIGLVIGGLAYKRR